MSFFFNTNEDLVLLKKDVLTRLKTFVPRVQHFFRRSQRSYKRNNPQKMKLDDYTVDALFFILCSRSFLNDYAGYKELMIPVLQSNYGTVNHPFHFWQANNILDDMEEEFQTDELFISFHNKMRKHVGGMLSTHQFQEVMKLYRRHLTPRYYEKKNLGQVFTPFVLIDKILDQIPNEIMSDPTSTFFDPSAGMGGFLVALYKRLMASLSHIIPNKEERHNHILSKMLFASEITRNNVAMMKKIFGNAFHVHHGDTLTMDPLKEFGVAKFRVIVGNPPFEKPQKTESRKTAGDSLWDDFVRKSFGEWLLPGGFFGMLLPAGWRKPSDEKSTTHGLWELMTVDNTPEWVEMYNDKETKDYFEGNVAIRMDLVFVKNEKNNKKNKTMIRGTDGKIYREKLMKFPFLPNAHLKEWKKMLTKDQKEGINVLYSTAYHTQTKDLKEEKTREFKYPVIHSILKDDKKTVRYTNKKDQKGGFGISKLIFNGYGGWNQPILDMEGKYGMSQVIFALPVSTEKQGKRMIKFFNKDRLKMFSDDLTWATSKPFIFWKLFRNVRKDFYKN